MIKYIFGFALIGCVMVVKAQEPTEIEKKLTETSTKVNNLEKDLLVKVDGLSKEFEVLKKDYEEAKKKIVETTNIQFTINENEYLTREKRLIQTSNFVKSSNRSFNAINSAIAQAAFMKDVIVLNNPTNDDVGFSLQRVINDLIEKHILSKDRSLGKAGKVNSFVNSLIEHPITEIAKSAIPAINTVVSFISNISFGSKKIDQKDFDNFNESLKKYIEHYEGLANSTREYEANLEQIRIRSLALQTILQNFTKDRITTLNGSPIEGLDLLKLNEILNRFYRDDIIQAKINEIVKDKLNHTRLSEPKLAYPQTVLSQAGFIQDELGNLKNQYINSHKEYLSSIIKVLQKSKDLEGANKERIQGKIEDLNRRLTESIELFAVNVDEEDVKQEFKELIK